MLMEPPEPEAPWTPWTTETTWEFQQEAWGGGGRWTRGESRRVRSSWWRCCSEAKRRGASPWEEAPSTESRCSSRRWSRTYWLLFHSTVLHVEQSVCKVTRSGYRWCRIKFLIRALRLLHSPATNIHLKKWARTCQGLFSCIIAWFSFCHRTRAHYWLKRLEIITRLNVQSRVSTCWGWSSYCTADKTKLQGERHLYS